MKFRDDVILDVSPRISRWKVETDDFFPFSSFGIEIFFHQNVLYGK